jgi:hypothetical protein
MFQSLLKFRLNGGQLMAKTDNLLLLKLKQYFMKYRVLSNNKKGIILH